MPLLTPMVIVALGLVSASVADKLLVSHYTGQIYSLDLTVNGGNGTLKSTSSASGCGKMPSWLTLDSESGTLYCFDESGAGQQGVSGGVVTSYTVNTDGSLTQSGQANTSGGDVHGWYYGGADGRGFIATAEYDASTITTYKLPFSSSTQTLQKQEFTMSAPGPNPDRQTAPHPHSVITDPTSNYLLAPDLGADLIRVFSIDATSGQLTACTSGQAGAGDGPRHGAWWSPKSGSTDGQMLYTINELGNSVSAWTVSYPSSGCLTLSKTQTLSTYAAGKSAPANSKAAEVHVSGNFLYAANRNDQTFGAKEDSIVTYSIDPATGAIAFVEATNAYAWYPRTFAINKAGTLVAVGGQTSSNVAIIQRNATTGKLGSLVANLAVAIPGTDGGEDGLSAVIWDE
ncbi:putative 6-phosphogluconolactonase [Seiridium unicorne]|uniref:6-phosphogluconolactonase n=1 Tax=Seiridium unicorne TaxID=138068 RepID=A0ABR2UPX4_9PEZI